MNTMQTHIQLWLLLRCLGSAKSVRNILPRGWVLIIMSEPTCTLLYRNCGKRFTIYFIPYSPNQATNLEQYINQSTNLPSHSMERSGSHSVRSSNRQSELACWMRCRKCADNTLRYGKYSSAVKVYELCADRQHIYTLLPDALGLPGDAMEFKTRNFSSVLSISNIPKIHDAVYWNLKHATSRAYYP